MVELAPEPKATPLRRPKHRPSRPARQTSPTRESAPRRVRRVRRAPPQVEVTELVYSAFGVLNLLKLHPELQALARWTFDWAEDYVLGRHAFPDRRADLKLDFYACAFQTGADSIDSPPELKFAVENNVDFLERVSKLVCFVILLRGYAYHCNPDRGSSLRLPR